MEQWRDVEGFEGYYQVSDLGRVRSVKRTIVFSDGRIRHYAGNVLGRGSVASSGYRQVYLCKNGQKTYHYVHRLVANAFVPNPHDKPTVNHKDENKLNNCASNLEWLTQGENNTYNDLHHRRKYNYSEKCRQSVADLHKRNQKPVLMIGKDGNTIAEFESILIASQRTGIDRSSIQGTCAGNKRSAGGYKWQYAGRG